MEKTRVLFLCTGNSCRSQMAEASLRAYGGDAYDVYSAGLIPKTIDPLVYRVMAEEGIDLSGQRSKGMDEYQGKVDFDYVITVCADDDQNCPVFYSKTAQQLHWPFDDPTKFMGSEAERLEKFRDTRDAIASRIKQWVDQRASA